MPDRPPRSRTASTTPEEFPTTSSQLSPPGADYSYTVELVATINRELGRLTEAVTSLKEQSKEQGSKLDKVSHQVYGAKVGLWMLGIIIAAAGSVCGFILKMILDAVIAISKH